MKKRIDDLTFADDFMFAAVLKNKDICKKFLEIVLEKKIEDIVYVEEQKQIKMSYSGKGTRLDVYVKDIEGNVFDVEIQCDNTKELPKRARYYQSNMDVDTLLKSGEHYKTLRDNYVIFVCRFDPFGKGRYKYTFQNKCDECPDLLLNDGTKKIFLNAKGIEENISFGVLKLLAYIERNEVGDEFTESIEAEVTRIKNDEYWRKEYADMMTWEEDIREKALTEGRAEGRAKGKAENKIETVLNMLKENLPHDVIKRCTGVSDEELEKIMKMSQN